MGCALGRYEWQHKSGFWYYHRQVPIDLVQVIGRKHITKTTRRKDLAEARVIIARMNVETERFWQALQVKPEENQLERYEAAMKRARLLGVSYRPMSDVLLDMDDLDRRMVLLEETGAKNSLPATDSILGGVDRPEFDLDGLLDQYMELIRDQLADKDPEQIRKWKTLRSRAVANFKICLEVSNKQIVNISRDDALDFRGWWIDRVIEEGLTRNAGNKELSALNVMINELDEKYRLGVDGPFKGVRLKGELRGERKPYASDYIQNRILKSSGLAGINDQAHAILMMCIFTGCRPSEVTNLMPDEIRLGHEVPHVEFTGAFRPLKTAHAYRALPVPSALVPIMGKFKQGFPRYRGKNEGLSQVLNKFLRENDLKPTRKHSLYSFRHSFDDRMTALKIDGRIQADLMGHEFKDREKYGAGASLIMKSEYMEKLGFDL